ncbi:MAG: methylglyoxal synthase [Pseudomonadota bacterium]
MAFDFIFMLTEDDRTIADARDRLQDVLAGGARHIGFKDIGIPFDELKALAADIRAAGGRAYLEVVSLDEESELRSAKAAIDLEVDCLLGGTRAAAVTSMLKHHPIRYYPFPGEIMGHPSVLAGSIEDITESAKRLTELESVHGLDLLAYRFEGDVPALMKAVCEATDKPVIMAGSIDQEERIKAVAHSGAAGFTVGTAAFRENFPASREGLMAQVQSILSMTGKARQLSASPRRIALVAHNNRKSQLLAWVQRHAQTLSKHRIVCTGGTGSLLGKETPNLSIHRLQRGSHGGDQQLGALVATGELDAVIFFADPQAPGALDQDLLALIRLSIQHDIPIACSPAAADMFVSASL